MRKNRVLFYLYYYQTSLFHQFFYHLELEDCKALQTKAEKRTCMKEARAERDAAIDACNDDGNDDEETGLAQIMIS